MKKLIVFTLLFALSTQGCHTRKKVQQTKVKTDSTAVAATVKTRTDEKTDSGFVYNLIKTGKAAGWLSVEADKVTKTTQREDATDITFTLDVDKLQAAGDSAIAKDVRTGTTAIIYKAATGQLNVNIRKPGKHTETYELSGLKLKSKNSIDTSSNTTIASGRQTSKMQVKDSSASAVVVTKETSTRNKEISRDFGLFKTIGLVVAGLLVLRLVIYLFRAVPWIGWINKLLSFKK